MADQETVSIWSVVVFWAQTSGELGAGTLLGFVVRVMVNFEASRPARPCWFNASAMVFFMPTFVIASVEVGVGGEVGGSTGAIAEGDILQSTYRYSFVGRIVFVVVCSRLCWRYSDRNVAHEKRYKLRYCQRKEHVGSEIPVSSIG